MADEASFAIEILGVPHMERVEAAGERAVGPGDTNIMNMIWHQAIGPELDAESCCAFMHEFQVAAEIGIVLKNNLSVVPPLGHLMGIPDDGGTR